MDNSLRVNAIRKAIMYIFGIIVKENKIDECFVDTLITSLTEHRQLTKGSEQVDTETTHTDGHTSVYTSPEACAEEIQVVEKAVICFARIVLHYKEVDNSLIDTLISSLSKLRDLHSSQKVLGIS